MNAQISYCGDLPEPWQVFQPDGGKAIVGPEFFGGWVQAAIPTGETLGYFPTLDAARVQFPTAWLDNTAKAAIAAGCL